MILILVVVFLCSAVLTWWLASSYSLIRIEDHPNERSLHQRSTPRSGGLAILIAMVLGFVLIPNVLPNMLVWIFVAVALVTFISVLDDVRCVSPVLRLVIHFVAAALVVVVGGIALPWGSLGLVVSLFGVVWMLNLYNFMDGMDGFAGGMGVVGFATLSIAAWIGGGGDAQVHMLVLASAIVAAATLGFLLFNLPPARIFLGDAGSIPLGLLAAGFSLWGMHDGLFEWWLPMLAFSVFIVDATVTLIRRGVNGERCWEPHCSHYYQRLVKLGWGHRKTVLAEYVVMLATSISGLVFMLFYQEWFALLLMAWAVIFFSIAMFIQRMESRATK